MGIPQPEWSQPVNPILSRCKLLSTFGLNAVENGYGLDIAGTSLGCLGIFPLQLVIPKILGETSFLLPEPPKSLADQFWVL